MEKAYSYTRFSSAKQASGDSLRRQLAAAYAFAEKNNLALDTTIQDRGVSGYTGANRVKGALKSFLSMVEDGTIPPGSFLLIDSMDRLSRLPVVDASHQLLGIAMAGIRVVTLNDGRVFDRTASLPDMIMAVAEIERSHRESAEKGRKVAAAHARNKQLAREEGRVWHRTGPSWLSFDENARAFRPVPERVHVVQEIFVMSGDLGMGTTVIAQRLNSSDIKPFRKGALWHGTTVNKILRSRAVLGEYQPRFRNGTPDGDPVMGYFGPPVVSPELFHRAQTNLDNSRTTRGKRQGPTELRNLFAGIIRCAHCGSPMVCHRRSKDRVDLFQCYKMTYGLCENRKRSRVIPLEQAIMHALVEANFDTNVKTSKSQADLAAAEAERSLTLGRIENLLDLIESGDGLAITRYKKRTTELRNIDLKIEELSRKLSSYADATQLMARQEKIKHICQDLDGLSGLQLYDLRSRLRKIILSVVDGITISSSGWVLVMILGGTKCYGIQDGETRIVLNMGKIVQGDQDLMKAWVGDTPGRKLMLQKLVAQFTC